MKILVKQDLPYINKGEHIISVGVVDEKVATQLVVKGLADLLEGELQNEEKRASKEKAEKLTPKSKANKG